MKENSVEGSSGGQTPSAGGMQKQPSQVECLLAKAIDRQHSAVKTEGKVYDLGVIMVKVIDSWQGRCRDLLEDCKVGDDSACKIRSVKTAPNTSFLGRF